MFDLFVGCRLVRLLCFPRFVLLPLLLVFDLLLFDSTLVCFFVGWIGLVVAYFCWLRLWVLGLLICVYLFFLGCL